MPVPPGLPTGGGPNITVQTKLFEEKTARESQYAYDGEKSGGAWRSDVFDYFISKCPDAEPWLNWIEAQGSTKIDQGMIAAEAVRGGIMSEINPAVLSHHMWGFLQHGLSG